jgi:hypothetical protein
MTMNESIVEDAALEWFGELGQEGAIGSGCSWAGLDRILKL